MVGGSEVTLAEMAGWGGGSVGFLLICREIYKLLRSDVKEQRDSKQKDEILDHYKDLAQRHLEEAQEQARRADTFAEERNRAIEELGRLRGLVESLTGQIEGLEEKVKHLTDTIELMNRMCLIPVNAAVAAQQGMPAAINAQAVAHNVPTDKGEGQ